MQDGKLLPESGDEDLSWGGGCKGQVKGIRSSGNILATEWKMDIDALGLRLPRGERH